MREHTDIVVVGYNHTPVQSSSSRRRFRNDEYTREEGADKMKKKACNWIRKSYRSRTLRRPPQSQTKAFFDHGTVLSSLQS